MVAILFGPYLLAACITALVCFWWALVRDARSDRGLWAPFEPRSTEDFYKTFGDKPPY